ncbi:MAG: FtsQ-type POTRA domain-containing protein [Oscillospiraceae bacterium]|nr:FtsQ-type POTRA domain-containing protein [Oscillospiraceae bacterium]
MEFGSQRRVSKSAAIYIPIGVLLVVAFTLLGISSFLSIMDIEVEGAAGYTADEIIYASGISVGDNLLFLDTEAAERRITAAIPFVREATISRMLPDKLLIEVYESTPIAWIEISDDEIIVIDITARVLQTIDFIPYGLLEVRGVSPAEAIEGRQLRAEIGGDMQLQHMRDILTAFEREGMARDVYYLDMTHVSQISFGYMGRFRVLLGDPSNLRQKLNALPEAIVTIDERSGEDVRGVIDLTDPTGRVRFDPRA